jgi:hypothetical protein
MTRRGIQRGVPRVFPESLLAESAAVERLLADWTVLVTVVWTC